jgi:hypothetical protein
VGYQVIAVNTLAQWDRVGPRADDYPAHVVQEAESYLRRFVKIVHDGGAKAVFYLGPVQSPLQSPVFREKHPEWLRVNEDSSRSSDFVNFRNPEVIDWLCRQLACLARDYGADGFWFDGYSPVSLHTYDKATREAFSKFSHGADIPGPGKIRPEDPVSRLYLQWHEAYFAETADRIRRAVRAANPNCVIYGNTYISAMLVNAMRWVAQDAPPPVEVDGPLLLGTMVRRQRFQHRVVVHLLNDQSSYGRHSNYQNMLVKKAATMFSNTRLS